MKPRLSVITLCVDDLERSLRFYRDGLCLQTEGIVGREFEHGAVAFFDLQPGLKLAIWPRASLAHDSGLAPDAPSATECSLGHNVSSVRGSRCRDGTGQARGCGHRQAGAGHVLGWLRGLLPGPGRALVGSRLESAIVAGCVVGLRSWSKWGSLLTVRSGS